MVLSKFHQGCEVFSLELSCGRFQMMLLRLPQAMIGKKLTACNLHFLKVVFFALEKKTKVYLDVKGVCFK